MKIQLLLSILYIIKLYEYMKNFKFLLKDVYLLKLYSDKGYNIDCFAMKISDTINSYNSRDNYNFSTPTKWFSTPTKWFYTTTFLVYGDKPIKKIQKLEDEVFTLYYTNAVDFNEGTIDNRKFTCSNISYIKCNTTEITDFNIEKSEFCTDTRATITVKFLLCENLCDPNYCGHSYDEEEIFNRKDIVSIFNVNQNNSNTKLSVVDEESYFNNVDENCIVEEIANDMQKCLDKEITEKLNKAFEDTADSLLISNLMLM